MLKQFSFFKETSHQDKISHTVEVAREVCKNLLSSKLSHLNMLEYKYTSKAAVEELGIDDELVHELVEDYVAQIIKATLQFQRYILVLRQSQHEHITLDFTPLRDLAHKNLGVARNLRILDAQAILSEMMQCDDLDYLDICVEALRACSVQLNPECAYKTLKLIEVKSFLL
jgi:hypothetical protein